MNYQTLKAIYLFLFFSIAGLISCSQSTGEDYRDLNKNGQKDVYEDSSQPIDDRVDDLLSQMNVEEKAGLLFNAISGLRMGEGMPRVDSFINQLHINHMDISDYSTPQEFIDFNNLIQKKAENTRLGIPITFYSDPRHRVEKNEAAGENRYHTRWPSELGFGAIGDEELVRKFADISRQEYLALGIKLALHPQADLATEPRWFRTYTTFGSDADMSAKLTAAYVKGFQGKELGPNSVLTMTKHFPGGGPQEGGMDSHFATGKRQVYPGGMFDYHMKPFTEGAIPAGTRQLMLYYGQPVGVTQEEVAFAFNKEIVTDILRDSLGFDGVVCTDWAVVFDNPAKPASAWGVESLSPKERVLKVLNAGVDMFGGESCAPLIVELVNERSLSEERLNESVRRVLYDKFAVGLFDNPYLSEEGLVIFENEEYRNLGKEAQRRSLVLAKNEDQFLPLTKNVKVFVDGFDSLAVSKFASVTNDILEADVCIMKLATPFTPVEKPEFFLQRLFQEGRLDFPAEEKASILEKIKKVPTVTVFSMKRPAILTEINEASKALIVDFECEDEIIAELIFGDFSPSGKLPVELPSSVEAVEKQLEDVPADSENPLYQVGAGLSY